MAQLVQTMALVGNTTLQRIGGGWGSQREASLGSRGPMPQEVLHNAH